MKNVIITGSSGFVGSNFVKYFTNNYNLYCPKRDDLKELFENNQKFDGIIHLAGKAHDLKSNSLDDVYFKINTEIIKTILLIELCSAIQTPLTPLFILLVLILIPLYYFNFKKNRKVFLGDGGSLLLGTMVSIYIFYILGNEYEFKSSFQINKVLFTVLVILYPLLDLLRVFILRIKEGRSPFTADQNHLHHLLVKKGISHKFIVLIIFTSTLSIFFFTIL